MSQYQVIWCPCSFKVEDEELIKIDSKCKDFLIVAFEYRLRKGNDSQRKGSDNQMVSTPRTRMRTPIGSPKVNTLLFLCCIVKLKCFSISDVILYRSQRTNPFFRQVKLKN